MNEEHQEIQELLAGYALEALTGPDAARAEMALSEHVPTCASCREVLDGFRAVVGDLGLAATPRAAPDLVWASLRRKAAEPELGTALQRRRFAMWSAAAAAVALFGLAGWNAFLNQRVLRDEGREAVLAEAVSTVGHPDARVVPFRGSMSAHLSAAYVPGTGRVYLMGSGLGRPHHHHVYRIWFTSGGVPVASATTFVPEGGTVIVLIRADPSRYEGIWVTEEQEDQSPDPEASPLMTAGV